MLGEVDMKACEQPRTVLANRAAVKLLGPVPRSTGNDDYGNNHDEPQTPGPEAERCRGPGPGGDGVVDDLCSIKSEWQLVSIFSSCVFM